MIGVRGVPPGRWCVTPEEFTFVSQSWWGKHTTTAVVGGTARKWFGTIPTLSSPPQGTTERWVENPKCALGPGVRDISLHTDVRMLGPQEMPDCDGVVQKWCLYGCSCGYNEYVPGRCPDANGGRN